MTQPGIFREYQVEMINKLLDDAREKRECVVEWPTGSGKTIVMCAFALKAMGLGYYEKIIIATTQNHIRATFTGMDKKFLLANVKTPGVAAAQIDLSYLISSSEGERKASSAAEILDYLDREGSQEGTRVCSHMALVSDSMNLEGLDLSNCALILDEGHHSGEDETKLGQFVAKWRELGGKYYLFSASPYRTDRRKVILEGMKRHFRSIHEHQEKGFAPKKINTAIFSKEYAEGSDSKSRAKNIADAMRIKWEEIGRPPLMIKLPAADPGRAGDKTILNQFIEAFTAKDNERHINIVDATGIEAKEEFQRILKDEDCEYSERANPIDVIIGVSRISEGTDWRHCSAVFTYGLTRSASGIVQLNGRAMREKKKESGHPFCDDVFIYNFVDVGEGKHVLAEENHSQIQMILCAQNEYGSSISYPALSAFSRGCRRAVDKVDMSSVDDMEDIEISNLSGSENPAEMTEASQNARTCLAVAQEDGDCLNIDGSLNIEKLIEYAVNMGGEREEVENIIRQVLVAQDDGFIERLEDFAEEFQERKMRPDAKIIDPNLREILKELMPDFCERTLVKHKGLEGLFSQFHILSGKGPREFADIFYARINSDIWLDRAHKIFEFKNFNGGNDPKPNSENIDEKKLCRYKHDLAKRYYENKVSTECKLFIEEKNLFPIEKLDTRFEIAKSGFKWMDCHNGKGPNRGSNDIEEKRLASNLKDLKIDYLKNNLSEKCNRYIEGKNLFPDTHLEKAKKSFEWISSHNGSQPSMKSDDPEERKLAYNYWDLKEYYYEDKVSLKCRAYIEEKNLFSIKKIEKGDKVKIKIKKYLDWSISHNGETPKINSKDPEERSICNSVYIYRRLYKQGKLREEICRILEDNNLVENKDIKLSNAIKCFEWKNLNGRWPSQTGPSAEEKSLGGKLNHLRLCYKKNKLSSACRLFMEQHNMLSV